MEEEEFRKKMLESNEKIISLLELILAHNYFVHTEKKNYLPSEDGLNSLLHKVKKNYKNNILLNKK